jgi:hypothetical protein
MKLARENESALVSEVKKIFVSDPWDLLHTFSAVKWMKEIVRYEGGDEKVLLTVMYLHDIGYAGLISEGYTLSERIEAKKKHMDISADLARGILSKLDYSQKEIDKIIALILTHDVLDGKKSLDESKVIEADSLAQIDPDVGNNFGEEEFAKYVEIFGRKRYPRIVSRTGKIIFEKLSKKNKLFFKYASFLKK